MGDSDGLFRDERVLWKGTPAVFRVRDPVSKMLLGIGVFYGLFPAAVMAVAVAGGNGWPVLTLLGVFVVGWLTFTVALFVQWRSAWYLITDRRIVVASRWLWRDRVRSTDLRTLAPPVVSVPEGSTTGTIMFGDPVDIGVVIEALFSYGQRVPLVLRDVEDVRRVRDIVTSALAG
jgi:hypothetical protein